MPATSDLVVAGAPGARPALVVPASELRWRFSRASGPGGQGVNTTDSRVELLWDVAASAAPDDRARERLLERLAPRLVDGVLTVVAAENREQRRNRDAARTRMAALLAAALAPPPPPRRPSRPSMGARRRRMEGKQQRSSTKALRRRPGD